MRRLVAALVLATLVLTVAGCGGGGAEETAAPVDEAPVTPPPAAPTEPGFITDRSVNETSQPPVPFPSFNGTATPQVIQEKLDDGRAMLIFFFDPAQQVTKDARAEVDAVMKDYRGLIDLVTFNTGGAATSESARNSVTYANQLAVDGTPYILVVDEGGFITWRWRGYVEQGVIGREVERATQ